MHSLHKICNPYNLLPSFHRNSRWQATKHNTFGIHKIHQKVSTNSRTSLANNGNGFCCIEQKQQQQNCTRKRVTCSSTLQISLIEDFSIHCSFNAF